MTIYEANCELIGTGFVISQYGCWFYVASRTVVESLDDLNRRTQYFESVKEAYDFATILESDYFKYGGGYEQ